MTTTTATFTGIKKKIQEQIEKSKNSIKISVAWFTSKDLLGQLIDKVENGCQVEIIISDNIENKRLSFDKFIKVGGKVFIMQTRSGKFLHDKFAVFDKNTLIAGSYNWTNSAEYYNHEFIIQSEENILLKQFNIRFKNLKEIVTNYDQLILSSKSELLADTKESEFIKLENELEERFMETIKEANDLGAKINSNNIISYIHNYGAIGGASRLINLGTEKLQSGFIKLWEIKRLDISFESIILQEKYRILFSKEILEKADKRLKKIERK
jgi:phosphatidylserine/phosphatidylglycerophosphate/cardiolipin synthase-like enzyme